MSRLRDQRWFWVVILVFSITTLGLGILVETGRPIYLVATLVGHVELVLIGTHLVRTHRATPKK